MRVISTFLGCVSSVNSTFLGETYEHGAGHEKPTLVVVPSAVKAFSWLFPTPRPGAGNPGLSPDASTPRTRAAEESPGSTRGRGEGRKGRGRGPAREVHLRRGNLASLGRRPWPRPTEHGPREAQAAGPPPLGKPAWAGAAGSRPLRGVANRKRKSRGNRAFPLIRFTL